jgi:hypothetical protein
MKSGYRSMQVSIIACTVRSELLAVWGFPFATIAEYRAAVESCSDKFHVDIPNVM